MFYLLSYVSLFLFHLPLQFICFLWCVQFYYFFYTLYTFKAHSLVPGFLMLCLSITNSISLKFIKQAVKNNITLSISLKKTILRIKYEYFHIYNSRHSHLHTKIFLDIQYIFIQLWSLCYLSWTNDNNFCARRVGKNT